MWIINLIVETKKKREKETKGNVVIKFTIASRQIIEQKHKL